MDIDNKKEWTLALDRRWGMISVAPVRIALQRAAIPVCSRMFPYVHVKQISTDGHEAGMTCPVATAPYTAMSGPTAVDSNSSLFHFETSLNSPFV
jgi:hypothetical protein